MVGALQKKLAETIFVSRHRIVPSKRADEDANAHAAEDISAAPMCAAAADASSSTRFAAPRARARCSSVGDLP